MNIFKLSITYILRRPLSGILNLMLIASGVAIIVTMLIFTKQIEEKLVRELSSVDLVVGAKGSPLQLILSSLMNADVPTGNITMQEAKKIAAHPLVRFAVPISLGDNYKGFRIIGTNNFYYGIFGQTTENDNYRVPSQLFEALIGSEVAEKTGLKYGDKFYSSHGIAAGGEEHKESPYIVTGILKRTGKSIDRVILTNSETIIKAHAEHGDDSEIKFTALLVIYNSPTAAAIVPKFINEETGLMAASPAVEITKMLKTMGIGVDAIMIFAYLIIAVSAFAIFISLINSLRERSYDIAIMRAMGATRLKIFFSIIIEGILISIAGAVIGILIGHLLTQFIIISLNLNEQINISGFIFSSAELYIIPAAIIFGFISSLIPGIQAYRYNIATLLARE